MGINEDVLRFLTLRVEALRKARRPCCASATTTTAATAAAARRPSATAAIAATVGDRARAVTKARAEGGGF